MLGTFAKKIIHLSLYLSISFLFVACSVEDFTGERMDNSPVVVAVFPPDALGDLGYNDGIYLGVQTVCNELGLRSVTVEPLSYEAGAEYLKDNLTSGTTADTPRLFLVVADAGYDDFIERYGDVVPDDEMTQVVFIGKRRAGAKGHALYLPMYGAMWEAGRLARAMDDVRDVVVVTADDAMPVLAEARQGFTDGYGTDDGRKVVTYSLDNETAGFNMADALYAYSFSVAEECQMVVPLCGGSSQGFYRYNREHPSSFYTVGIDADMERYSSRVPFSCVKRMDKAVAELVRQWRGGELPRVQSWGLASGYVDVVVSSRYAGRLDAVKASLHDEAIRKETAYEK